MGQLTIQSGGKVSNSDGHIGRNSSSDGTVTVNGTDSSWENNGTLHVGRSGVGMLSIESGGKVSNTTGYIGRNSGSDGTVTVDGFGSAWTNSDALDIGPGGTGVLNVTDGGRVEVTNKLSIGSSGTVNLTAGTIDAGSLTNEGALALSGGATDLHGAVNNTAGGSIIVSGSTTASFRDDLVHNGTEFQVGAGSQAIFYGAVSGSSDYTGSGELVFEGELNPGNSPGLVNVAGDMTLGSGSQTTFELGGLLRGTEYDAFNVGDELSLDGVLEVVVVDLGAGLFDPQAGNFFDLFQAETITGNFNQLNLVTLDPGLIWKLDFLVDENGSTDVLRLSVAAVPLPPAVWLFVTALVGLGVVKPRRKRV